MTIEEMRALHGESQRIAAEFCRLFGRLAPTLEQIATLPEEDMRDMVLEVAAELRVLANGTQKDQ